MNNNRALCKTEEFLNDEHDYVERFTNGSIQVNPESCIIYFEPGITYKFKIEFRNETTKIQTIQIQPLENSEFRIPNMFTVEIYPKGLWKLPVTFVSHSIEEFKSLLKVKNPTGQGNLAVVLKALPKMHCSRLPKTINFGNVDIGTSVTRKFTLTPESNPYQFRIFIPYGVRGLDVNPTCGEVSTDSPTVIAIVYAPESFVTLSTDLVVYRKRGDQKPRVVRVTALTRPETVFKITNLKVVNKKQKEFHYLSPSNNAQRDKVNKCIKPTNRLTLNKMLLDKCTPDDIHYTWLNPLGDSDKLYREAYLKRSNDFLMNAKRFGDVHKHAKFKIPRCELNLTEEQIKYIIDKREAEWKLYKDKLYSYQRISCDEQLEPMGIRQRSIRINSISTCEWNFSLNPDNNWWMRYQAFNRFVNAVYIIVIKVRLLKILSTFRTLKPSDLIHFYHGVGHDIE